MSNILKIRLWIMRKEEEQNTNYMFIYIMKLRISCYSNIQVHWFCMAWSSPSDTAAWCWSLWFDLFLYLFIFLILFFIFRKHPLFLSLLFFFQFRPSSFIVFFMFSNCGRRPVTIAEHIPIHVVLLHLKFTEFVCTRCQGFKFPKKQPNQ